MKPDTKAFVKAWFASVDTKTLMTDYYRQQLGVEDLSTIEMVSEDEMMTKQMCGPRMAIRADGSFLYEKSPFLYRFPDKA